MTDTTLQSPLDAIVFDCDGTLSKIEGVNYLAETNDVGEAVTAMTEDAMAVSGLSPDLYAKRLLLIRPTFSQLLELGNAYYEQRVDGVAEIIQALQQRGKQVFIISAGILQSVIIFAEKLQVPRANVFAVPVYHDDHGKYVGFDTASPLVQNHGKSEAILELQKRYPRIGLVGDGLNDLCCQGLVSRFIGFGGVFNRPSIAAQTELYITNPDISQLLPLLLTDAECSQ